MKWRDNGHVEEGENRKWEKGEEMEIGVIL